MPKRIPAVVLGAALLVGGFAAQADNDSVSPGQRVKHVLLISVDGLHALDLANYVATHKDSTLAALSLHGVTYTNNSTSTPSDSFPGSPLSSRVARRSRLVCGTTIRTTGRYRRPP